MPFMSRAGLASFILFLTWISLVTSAPVSERLSSLVKRYDDMDDIFLTRSLLTLGDREFDIADPDYTKREYFSFLDDRGFDSEDDEYTKRQDDISLLDGREFDLEQYVHTKRDEFDIHRLYRRKSIFTKIKDDFHKVGHALKTGFKKVGTFIKKNVGKVAKVWLKWAAAVGSVAAKVVKFIPGVGTGLSTAIKGAVIGANAASDKIHANIGKLGKFTKGLDYVISPMGSAGKAASKKGGKAGRVLGSLFT